MNEEKRNLKIVFCLPGNNFSGNFLTAWSELLQWCIKQDIKVIISQKYSSMATPL